MLAAAQRSELVEFANGLRTELAPEPTRIGIPPNATVTIQRGPSSSALRAAPFAEATTRPTIPGPRTTTIRR
ncbi:MAG: hypothetical protein H6833_12070 [Planctomycetes bacterium]|nr:hypothetical protein [Planctomycetota bacterium]